jgi:single-strand DNA-binding protein
MSTSRSLNKVFLIGNLTRNPVIRQTSNGSIVCSFGIATNSTWKDSKGNLQERTEFHNIVAWNKLGEICAVILAVGMLVYIEGELRTRTWEDANGNKHFKTEIKLEDMKLLDDKGKKGVGIDSAKSAGETLGSEDLIDEEPVETASAPITTPSIPEKSNDGDELF